METVLKTIKLDVKLLKSIKNIAKKENTTEEKVLNELIEKGLENKEGNNTIPDDLILNKDTYNPDPERRRKFIGIIKTDEPFDTAKAIDEIRQMEY